MVFRNKRKGKYCLNTFVSVSVSSLMSRQREMRGDNLLEHLTRWAQTLMTFPSKPTLLFHLALPRAPRKKLEHSAASSGWRRAVEAKTKQMIWKISAEKWTMKIAICDIIIRLSMSLRELLMKLLLICVKGRFLSFNGWKCLSKCFLL